MANGSPTGSGAWAGYGTASYSIVFASNSDGESEGLFTPARAANNNPSGLDPFGMGPANGTFRWLDIYPGKIDDTLDNSNVGYSITFSFSDGLGGDTFPSMDPVFYLSDIDGGDFLVEASNDGLAVDTSSWYFATVQAATPEQIASSSNGLPGIPSYWDPATSSLVGQGQSTNWVHQFRPTGNYDSLTFTYSGTGPNDRVFFAIGDVAVVPEPSGALLLGLTGVVLVMRRKRPETAA